MIRLGQSRGHETLELPFGVKVTVAPLTSASMAMCQAEARSVVETLKQHVEQRREAGLPPDPGLPALDHEAGWEGCYVVALGKALAAAHIRGWEGVAEATGAPASVSRSAISEVMDQYPMAEQFFARFTQRYLALVAAKNVSGPLPAGTGGEGQNTAGDVMSTASLAPGAD